MATKLFSLNTKQDPLFFVADDGTGGGPVAGTYATFAVFPPAAANQGAFAIAQDTNALYCANNGNWFIIAVLA